MESTEECTQAHPGFSSQGFKAAAGQTGGPWQIVGTHRLEDYGQHRGVSAHPCCTSRVNIMGTVPQHLINDCPDCSVPNGCNGLGWPQRQTECCIPDCAPAVALLGPGMIMLSISLDWIYVIENNVIENNVRQASGPMGLMLVAHTPKCPSHRCSPSTCACLCTP